MAGLEDMFVFEDVDEHATNIVEVLVSVVSVEVMSVLEGVDMLSKVEQSTCGPRSQQYVIRGECIGYPLSRCVRGGHDWLRSEFRCPLACRQNLGFGRSNLRGY